MLVKVMINDSVVGVDISSVIADTMFRWPCDKADS
jgi:hypothetical protein